MASPAISRSPLQRSYTFRNNIAAANSTLLSPASSTLDTFSSDPILSAFLSLDFDPTQFSSSALSSGSAVSRIENLQAGLRLVDTQLRRDVLSRHHDLLHQLSSIRATESSLSSLRSSISSLQSSLRHARSELSDSHRAISTLIGLFLLLGS